MNNIELLNLEDFDPEDKDIIDLQLVDYMTTFGAYLDRDTNDAFQVRETMAGWRSRNNLKSFQFTTTESPGYEFPGDLTQNI